VRRTIYGGAVNDLVVTIIGLPPRDLTILDRLIEVYRWKKPGYEPAIHVIDPPFPGQRPK
jgi:hypothetical protein